MSEKLMRELVDKLNLYNKHYYVLDDPIVSDKEYDALYDQLVELEKKTGIVLPDSPTKRVGSEPIKAFGTHRHLTRLYSLDKCNTKEELINWYNRVKTLLGHQKFSITLEQKLDGLTLCLTYNNGLYERATTRGNGEVGEDVTEQVRTIKDVPLSIPYKGLIEVQGEGIMRISDFEEYNKTAAEPLKNPRNGAAGAIRNLDPKVTAKRRLSVIFYNVNYYEGEAMSQTQMIDFLKQNGFRTADTTLYKDIEHVYEAIVKIDRGSLDHVIDGMVIKINEPQIREKLGFTDKFPRWAIAYKFEAEETTTIIRHVEWNVGRTGKITPLALVDPVELAGATVSRATLNNMDDIARKNLKVGSRVFIRRSNDVIPEITGLAEGHPTDKEITLPDACPSCHGPLTKNGVNYFCYNPDCRSQAIKAIEHFVSKDCMDIEGISEKTIAQMFDRLGVNSPDKLYTLTYDDLFNLEAVKDKKAKNIIDTINKSRKCTLAAFINAIGIPNIGKKTARELAQKFGSLENLKKATVDELLAIEDIGPIMAEGIVEFFKTKSDYINELLKYIEIEKEKGSQKGLLTGLKFVITGTLPSFTRSEATKLIEDNGGVVSSSVTSDTNYLLCGEDAGSKLQKAKEKGIRIIDEQQLRAMLKI